MKYSDHLTSFLDHLKHERRASDHTLRNYESDLRQFLRHLDENNGKNKSLREGGITRDSIRGWMSNLRLNHSKRTIARKLSAVRTFCQFLTRRNILQTNPANLVATPRREQRLPHYLSLRDTTNLIEAPDLSTDLGERDRAILELLYATGIRVSELVNLDVGDVELRPRLLRVTNHQVLDRLVPFGELAVDALKHYLAIRDNFLPGHDDVQPLFVNYLGQRMTARAVRRIVSKHDHPTNRNHRANPRTLRAILSHTIS